MDKCNAELCINWTGSGCICDVMGLDKHEARHDRTEETCLYCVGSVVFEFSADGPTERACVEHAGVVLVDLSDRFPENHISACRVDKED
jgi:hypothetical protein